MLPLIGWGARVRRRDLLGTQLKQHAGAVLAGLALLVAILATTPGIAGAQNLNRADRTVGHQVAAQNAGQVGNR